MSRIHTNTAVEATLASGVSDTADALELDTVEGWPAPGSGESAAAKITDGGTIEVVTYTGITGTTLTGVVRDADGDTPAQNWDAGATVQHVVSAGWLGDRLSEASAKATYALHVGTATAPITSTTEARPHSDDGMVIWFTDYSESGDEPTNMEPQDLQVRVDEAENGGS